MVAGLAALWCAWAGSGPGVTSANDAAPPSGLGGGRADGAPDPGSSDAGAGAPSPEGCVQDVSAGHHVYACDGISYETTVPGACLAGGCGIIVDVHGFSMSGPMQEANIRLAERAVPRGFIVVQPRAPGTPPLASWTPGTDDAKVFAMLERLERVFHVDGRRVHFTGFSQGAAMTWRMLCAHADAFASVAPAAEAGCTFLGADHPSREVPTLYLFGTQDKIVSFSTIGAAQRDAVITGWQPCAGATLAGDAGFSRTRHLSPSGTPFELIQHEYVGGSCIAPLGGHCFPGSSGPGTVPGQACTFGCLPPSAFDWGAEVLAFFEAHPRP